MWRIPGAGVQLGRERIRIAREEFLEGGVGVGVGGAGDGACGFGLSPVSCGWLLGLP